MIIAVINYFYKPNQKAVDAGRKWWREIAKIADKGGLHGEFLSVPIPAENFDFPVDDLHSPHDEYWRYTNFGLWEDYEWFEQEIVPKISGKVEPFEAKPRERSIFSVREVRLGGWLSLPDPTCE